MSDRADRIKRGQDLLRRQGRADAVAMLVAKRFRPGLTLDDYARVLEVSDDDVRQALKRRRPGPPPSPPAPRTRTNDGPHACPEPGCDATYDDRRGLASHRRSQHTELIPCPNSCGRLINPVGVGPHLRHCTGAPA